MPLVLSVSLRNEPFRFTTPAKYVALRMTPFTRSMLSQESKRVDADDSGRYTHTPLAREHSIIKLQPEMGGGTTSSSAPTADGGHRSQVVSRFTPVFIQHGYSILAQNKVSVAIRYATNDLSPEVDIVCRRSDHNP